MNSSKVGYFSKLFVEDNEKDLVRFTIAGHEKKLKCHKSILTEKSPVFAAMFGGNWSDDGAVKMDDQVNFDQYEMFKIFIELVYEFRTVDSLQLTEAMAVYFYSHKYQMTELTNKVLIELNRMAELGISDCPFTAAELEKSLEFGRLYQLNRFNERLNHVRLALKVDNPLVFFELAKKYEMDRLQERIINHLKTVQPSDTWTLEVSHLVLVALQKDVRRYKSGSDFEYDSDSDSEY